MAGRRPLHRLECCYPARQPETCVRCYGRACNSGPERAVPEEDCCWLCGQGLKGLECLWPQLGVLAEAPRPPQKSSTIVKWHIKGAPFSTASLCLCRLQESTPLSLPGRLNKCKSVHTGRITHKALLFKTGNYIHYAVTNHNGKEYNLVTLLCGRHFYNAVHQLRFS